MEGGWGVIKIWRYREGNGGWSGVDMIRVE